jgi:hypothetical protein
VLIMLASVLLHAAPVSVAAPGLRSYGVDPKLVDAWLDRSVTVLSASGIKVTSHSDMEQALGFERQKQLMGCSDNGNSCLAELAGALGVDALLIGSVVKGESGYTVTLRIIGTSNSQEFASATGRFSKESALLDWLDETMPQLASKLRKALGREDVGAVSGSAGVPTLVRWTPAFIGVVAVGVGVTLLALSQDAAKQLKTPGRFTSSADIEATAQRGNTFQLTGWILSGVGTAAIAAGVLWGLLGGQPPAHASLMFDSHGGFLTLGGTWP